GPTRTGSRTGAAEKAITRRQRRRQLFRQIQERRSRCLGRQRRGTGCSNSVVAPAASAASAAGVGAGATGGTNTSPPGDTGAGAGHQVVPRCRARKPVSGIPALAGAAQLLLVSAFIAVRWQLSPIQAEA